MARNLFITKYQVDRLGALKAQIAELKMEHDKIVDLLKEAGTDVYDGNLFEANVFPQTKSLTDWEDVARALKAKPALIRKHTRLVETLVCKVTSRK